MEALGSLTDVYSAVAQHINVKEKEEEDKHNSETTKVAQHIDVKEKEEEDKHNSETTNIPQEGSKTAPTEVVSKKNKAKKKKKALKASVPKMSPQEKDELLKSAEPTFKELFRRVGFDFKKDLGFLTISSVSSLAFMAFMRILSAAPVDRKKHKEYQASLFGLFATCNISLQEMPVLNLAFNLASVKKLFALFSMINVSQEEKEFFKANWSKVISFSAALRQTTYYERPIYQQHNEVSIEKKQKVRNYVCEGIKEFAQFIPNRMLELLTEASVIMRKPRELIILVDQVVPSALSKLGKNLDERWVEAIEEFRVTIQQLRLLTKNVTITHEDQINYLKQMVRHGHHLEAFTSRLENSCSEYLGYFEPSKKQMLEEMRMYAQIHLNLGTAIYDFVRKSCTLVPWNNGDKSVDQQSNVPSIKFLKLLVAHIKIRWLGQPIPKSFAQDKAELRSLLNTFSEDGVEVLLAKCAETLQASTLTSKQLKESRWHALIECSGYKPQSLEGAQSDIFARLVPMLEQTITDLNKPPKNGEKEALISVDDQTFLNPLCVICIASLSTGVHLLSQKNETLYQTTILNREKSKTRGGYIQAYGSAKGLLIYDGHEANITELKEAQKKVRELAALAQLVSAPIRVLENEIVSDCVADLQHQMEYEDFDHFDQWLFDPIFDDETSVPKPDQSSVKKKKTQPKHEAEAKSGASESSSAVKKDTAVQVGLPVTSHVTLPYSSHVLKSLGTHLQQHYRIKDEVAPCDIVVSNQPFHELARYDQLFNLNQLTFVQEMLQSHLCSPRLETELKKFERLLEHLVIERGCSRSIRTKSPGATIAHSLIRLFKVLGLVNDGSLIKKLDTETLNFRYLRLQAPEEAETPLTTVLNEFVKLNCAVCKSDKRMEEVVINTSQEQVLQDFQNQMAKMTTQFDVIRFQQLTTLGNRLTKMRNDLQAKIRNERSPSRKKLLEVVCDQIGTLSEVPNAIMLFPRQRAQSLLAQWAFITLQYALKNTASIVALDSGLLQFSYEHPLKAVRRAMGGKSFNHIQAFSKRFHFYDCLSISEKVILDKNDVSKGYEYIYGYCSAYTEGSRSPYIELTSELYKGACASPDWSNEWQTKQDQNTVKGTELTEQLVDSILESSNVLIKLVKHHLLR